MNKELLRVVIEDQKKAVMEGRAAAPLPRVLLDTAYKSLSKKEITLITGVRRCGKSTLLKELIAKLLADGVSKENLLYLNFEDERLIGFTSSDFQSLNEIFPASRKPRRYFFLDEIQNVPMWEKWANRMYEFEDAKIVATGSNSSLLSSDVSGSLTGRNITLTEFPFSFNEIAAGPARTTEERARSASALRQYLEYGGFPQVLLERRKELLLSYLRDIIERDILKRHNVRNRRSFEEFAFYSMNLYSKRVTFEKLRNIFNLNSTNTAKKFLGYMEEAFLTFLVERYSNSNAQVVRAPRKLYAIDHALAQQVSNNPLQEVGSAYENIVFIELRRRLSAGESIYYWEDYRGREVDFILKKGKKPTAAIQVAYELGARKAEEVSTLLKSMRELGIREGTMITADLDDEEKHGELRIRYVPLWEWLCASRQSNDNRKIAQT